MNEERFKEDDFPGYLQEIIDLGGLEGPALGITKLVRDEGIGVLNDKQKFVFMKNVIDHYYVDECVVCSEDIPWCEMMEAVDNGGSCSWCAHRDSKDD